MHYRTCRQSSHGLPGPMLLISPCASVAIHARSTSYVWIIVMRSAPRPCSRVNSVDRDDNISEACSGKPATVRDESRERHLLGNDDHASVWPFLKVPFDARHTCVQDADHSSTAIGVAYADSRYLPFAIICISRRFVPLMPHRWVVSMWTISATTALVRIVSSFRSHWRRPVSTR
jgi:hypothetical protein